MRLDHLLSKETPQCRKALDDVGFFVSGKRSDLQPIKMGLTPHSLGQVVAWPLLTKSEIWTEAQSEERREGAYIRYVTERIDEADAARSGKDKSDS